MSVAAASARGRLRLARIVLPALLLVAGAGAALALSGPRPDLPPVADDEAPRLADLAWLAGHWRSEKPGRVVEEVWLPSRGGMLLGMNRTTTSRGGQFEFLRIDEHAGVISYLASPGGRPPTVFPLKSLAGQVVEFENPDHDFPKRIRYARTGDTLVASIHGDNDKSMSWTWTLVTALD